MEDVMAKKSKSTTVPPDTIKGVLKSIDNKLFIVAADGSCYSLEAIAKEGSDGANAELTVVVDLSKRALGRSDARAQLLSAIGALEQFLGERALGALYASATCGRKPPSPPPAKTPAKTPKPPKPGAALKPGKP